MKTFLTAAAIATGLTSTAMAGALEFVPTVEATLEAPATDWSGPYAGVMAAMGTGVFTENIRRRGDEIATLFLPYDIEGNMFGAFAGYNFQRGSLVFGVEGAYSTGSVAYSPVDERSWGWEFTSFVDLKARVGFAAGNALIYGFAGGTLSDLHWYGDGDFYFEPTGINYGAGIDLLVTDSIFIGAEYIVRELSDDLDGFDPTTMDATVNAVQIRAGMNF